MQRVDSLTSLRFFAALAVLCFHWNLYRPTFPTQIASFGYEAVTFFFVLSGFVLALAVKPIPWHAFMAARLYRIMPTYLVGLAISAPFYFRSEFDLLGVALVPLLLQAWIPSVALAWNIPAWSLSVEMFLYACFPRIFWSEIDSFALLCIALLGSALASGRMMLSVNHHFLAYFPFWHLPSFVAGLALGKIFQTNPLSRDAYRWVFVISTIGALVIAVGKTTIPWLSINVLLVVVFGSLIFGAAGAKLSILSFPSLVLLGDASYALYIIHDPLIQGWGRLHLQIDAGLDFLMFLMCACAISIGVTILFQRYLPRRQHRLLKPPHSGTPGYCRSRRGRGHA